MQTCIGFVKICKLVPNVVKKPRYPKDQKFQEITKYSELKKIQFPVCKGNLVHF